MNQSQLIKYLPKEKNQLSEFCRRTVLGGENPNSVFVDMFDEDFELEGRDIKRAIAKMKASADYAEAHLAVLEEVESNAKEVAKQTGMKILLESQKMLEKTGQLMEDLTDGDVKDWRGYMKAASLQNDTIRSIGGLIKSNEPQKAIVIKADYKEANDELVS